MRCIRTEKGCSFWLDKHKDLLLFLKKETLLSCLVFLPGFHTVVSAVRIPPFVILLFYQQQRLQVLVLRPYAMLIVSQQRSSIAAPRKDYELGGRGCQDTAFLYLCFAGRSSSVRVFSEFPHVFLLFRQK